jgi:hypothetical protein
VREATIAVARTDKLDLPLERAEHLVVRFLEDRGVAIRDLRGGGLRRYRRSGPMYWWYGLLVFRYWGTVLLLIFVTQLVALCHGG